MGLMGDSNYWSQYYDGSGVGWRPGPTRRLAASQIQGESQLLSISTAKWWPVLSCELMNTASGTLACMWPLWGREPDCQVWSLPVCQFAQNPHFPPTSRITAYCWPCMRALAKEEEEKCEQIFKEFARRSQSFSFLHGDKWDKFTQKMFSHYFSFFCRHQIAKSSGVKESLDRRIVIISNGFTFI